MLPPSSGVGREEKTAQCSVLPPSTTSSTSSGGREEKTAQVSCRDATAPVHLIYASPRVP